MICNTGSRDIIVQYPDARLTLYVETFLTSEIGLENNAMNLVLHYVSNLPVGKPPVTFGYVTANGQLSTMSQRASRIHLALQFIIWNYFRIGNVIAVRLGNSIAKTA